MAIKTSKSSEAYFTKYKTNKVMEKNRKLKLERLLKKQPNNLQIAAALKDIHYRRAKPKAPFWSHQMIASAMLMKRFTGKFSKDIFSQIPDSHGAAVKVRNDSLFPTLKTAPTKTKNYSMFSIFERVRYKE